MKIKKVPKEHNSSFEEKKKPLVMSMDFLRNPIFVPGKFVSSADENNFYVNGELATTIVGGILNSDAADVFYALTQFAKEQGFPQGKTKFVINDLLAQMNLSNQGKNYTRVKAAIDALFEVSVEMGSVNKRFGGSGRWRIITERYLFEKEASSHRLSSWVKFSDRMIEMFKSGALKAVHPIYFELDEPIDKRIFALLSVRAADTHEWKISVLTLRDLIPLLADKAKTPSGAAQQIEKNLSRLKNRGIIRKFEFSKMEGSKELFVEVELNPEYFFTAGIGKKKLKRATFSSKKLNAVPERKEISRELQNLVDGMTKRGIDTATAESLARNHPESLIRIQLAHLEYLEAKHIMPSNPAGFLIRAIEKGYAPPENMSKELEKANLSKAWFILDECRTLIRRNDRKSLESAIEKAKEAASLGREKAAKEVLAEAESCLGRLSGV